MNVSQIAQRVKHQFGDLSGVQITDDNIIQWINDGQRELVKTNEELLQTVVATNLVANQQEYALPVDNLILRSVYVKYPQDIRFYKLRGEEFEQFEELVNGWDGENNGGRPVIFTVYANNLMMWPIPEFNAVGAVKIYYNRKPVDVTDSTDTPDVPELYHGALVNYCLTVAHQTDENVELAGMKAQEFAADTSLLRGREGWKVQDTYPKITVRDEDAWL